MGLLPRYRERQTIGIQRNSVAGYPYTCIGGTCTQGGTFRYSYDYYSLREFCYDRVNPGYNKLSEVNTDVGGPLDLIGVRTSGVKIPRMTIFSANGVYKYVGEFMVSYAGVTINNGFIIGKNGELQTYGAEAWNRFKPGKPDVNLGVFLGELRDLPGQLRETASRMKGLWESLKQFEKNPMKVPYELFCKRHGSQAGQDYLSYQFGWAPFIGDLHRAIQLSQKINHRLKQIASNNGKPMYRTGVIDVDEDTEVIPRTPTWTFLWPALVTPMYAGYGTQSVRRTRSKRIWFSGKFRYYIPDIGGIDWKKRTIRKLYGLDVTPDLVWNLVPWSWLIDWFSSIGDFIANLDDGWADNLTAKYAYLMGTWKTHYEIFTTQAFGDGQKIFQPSTVTYWSKQRVSASPYGFGVSLGDLSAKRIAILAALGVARVKLSTLFS